MPRSTDRHAIYLGHVPRNVLPVAHWAYKQCARSLAERYARDQLTDSPTQSNVINGRDDIRAAERFQQLGQTVGVCPRKVPTYHVLHWLAPYGGPHLANGLT
jgi:hypothetical protein